MPNSYDTHNTELFPSTKVLTAIVHSHMSRGGGNPPPPLFCRPIKFKSIKTTYKSVYINKAKIGS